MSILWYVFFFFKQSFMIGSLNILDFTSNLCKAIFFFFFFAKVLESIISVPGASLLQR